MRFSALAGTVSVRSHAALSRATSVLGAAISACSARECARGRLCQILHPALEHALIGIQVTAGLRDRHAALVHQLHRLELELGAELPPHRHPPAPRSRSCRRVRETGSRQGSTSIDYELDAVIYDEAVTQELETAFLCGQDDCGNSR
ncbi:hypothetical protein Rumeso_04255 [Rubellimicrobium mesophilum DSM 19309]|uniref:Uncharacterized protein n=1 Tax=Rubellimicrobium mesophilum DSM 19309 TaxID=442562 RepID=A0A017HJ72_9RHOB|nr:hypothetical protein Rumeso_04255 [Rubellimicrobium mesophilum DSM 19309]